jgi:ribosomal protein L7Ae-like RNA K-turn-binding protein
VKERSREKDQGKVADKKSRSDRSKRGKPEKRERNGDDSFGLSQQQLLVVRRVFDTYAEGGKFRASGFNCIDPLRLLDALRELRQQLRELRQELTDADVRNMYGTWQASYSQRGDGSIDWLVFKKVVGQRVGRAVSPTKRRERTTPVALVNRAPPASMSQLAPWAVKPPAGPEVSSEEAVAGSPTPDTDAAFPVLGGFPVLGAVPDAAPTRRHVTLPEPPPERSSSPKPSHAAKAGAAQRKKAASKSAPRERIAAPVPKPAVRFRGWEKVTGPGDKVDKLVARAGEQGRKLAEMMRADAGNQGPGQRRSKTAERKERLNDSKTLVSFFKIKEPKKVAAKSKSKKKSDVRASKDDTLSLDDGSGMRTQKSRGITRLKPKAKKMSKLKRIILAEREERYHQYLAQRLVVAVCSARIHLKRIEADEVRAAAKAKTGKKPSKPAVPAAIRALVCRISRDLMIRWILQKAKRLRLEALAAISDTPIAESESHPEKSPEPEPESDGVAQAPQPQAAAASKPAAGEDSATEDSDNEDDDASGGGDLIAALPEPASARESDSATEDSDEEDATERAAGPASPPSLPPSAGQASAMVSDEAEDSATEDSATEDSDEEDGGGVVPALAPAPKPPIDEDNATEDEDEEDDGKQSATIATPPPAAAAATGDAVAVAPPATPVVSKPKGPLPRTELSLRSKNCQRVTFGNLPADLKIPWIKRFLEPDCGEIEYCRMYTDDDDPGSTRRCVVNFIASESVSRATVLMGAEYKFQGQPFNLKVDYGDRPKGAWEWLKEEEVNAIKEKKVKKKIVQEVPKETARQAAARRMKIPRIKAPECRAYCQQVITEELNTTVAALLKKLKFFQDRLKMTDPIKAKMRKRFVLGLREVRKGVRSRKIKCVILTPNIEQIDSKGGLDTFIDEILEECNKTCEDDDQNVEIPRIPVVFALSRNKLGKAMGKPMTLSIVGLFDVDGVNEEYKEMLKLTEAGRQAFAKEQQRASHQAEHARLEALKPKAPPEPEPEPEPEVEAERKSLRAAAEEFVFSMPPMQQLPQYGYPVPLYRADPYGPPDFYGNPETGGFYAQPNALVPYQERRVGSRGRGRGGDRSRGGDRGCEATLLAG